MTDYKFDTSKYVKLSSYNELKAENERLRLMGMRTTYKALAEENNQLRQLLSEARDLIAEHSGYITPTRDANKLLTKLEAAIKGEYR